MSPIGWKEFPSLATYNSMFYKMSATIRSVGMPNRSRSQVRRQQQGRGPRVEYGKSVQSGPDLPRVLLSSTLSTPLGPGCGFTGNEWRSSGMSRPQRCKSAEPGAIGKWYRYSLSIDGYDDRRTLQVAVWRMSWKCRKPFCVLANCFSA